MNLATVETSVLEEKNVNSARYEHNIEESYYYSEKFRRDNDNVYCSETAIRGKGVSTRGRCSEERSIKDNRISRKRDVLMRFFVNTKVAFWGERRLF